MTTISPENRVLDWVPAEDRTHEARFAFREVAPVTVTTVNESIRLPYWHWTHDQGAEGSCVGHGVGMASAIINTRQNRLAGVTQYTRRYDTIDIWNVAKSWDEWPDTNPGDDNGTSVHAGIDVPRKIGLIRVSAMKLDENGVPHPVGSKPRDPNEGVSAVRWTATVDDVRTAISMHVPVTIGINWYTDFDRPQQKAGYVNPFIGLNPNNLGSIRGGHCVVIYGASDSRQAVAIKNSWGRGYPLVWMTYGALERVLNEDGEAAIVTDR
jgi:hypothetical protein